MAATVRFAIGGVIPLFLVIALASRMAPQSDWLELALAQRRAIALATLIAEAAVVALAAPLIGVARLPGFLPVLGVSLSSALLLVTVTGADAGSLARLLTGHAALVAVALAGVALGRCARAYCRHELDAAGAATIVSAALTFGVVGIGPSIGPPPTWVTNALLAANPVVATAAAAGVDLLRTDPFYRLSPLAHLAFDYPAWWATVAWYLTFAAGARLAGAAGDRLALSSYTSTS